VEIKVKLERKTFFKSEIKGFLAFLKNVILLIRNQERVLFVDYLDDKTSLGEYRVPFFLEGQLYFYEVIEVPKEYIKYLPCIAKAIEEKVIPLYKNKKLSCKEGLVVIME